MVTPRKKFQPRAAHEGMVFLVGPPSVVAASVGGVEYEISDEGVFEVPAEHARELARHGFQPAPTASPA